MRCTWPARFTRRIREAAADAVLGYVHYGVFDSVDLGVEDGVVLLFALLRYVVASLLLVPLALLRGGLRRLPRPVPWTTLSLMALTGVGLYYVPVIGVASGVVLLGETITPLAIVGGALVLGGVWISARRPSAPAGGA